jgi:hypothetical protein
MVRAFLGSLGGCLIAVSACATSPTSTAGQLPGTRTSPPAATDASSDGLFTGRLVLDRLTTPANGEPIGGYLELTNNTGAPIVITNACNGWFGVGLTNAQIQHFAPGFSQVACGGETLPTGTTRRPLQISTGYASCVQPGGSASDYPPIPKCIGPNDTTSPDLPPGRYITSVGFQGFTQNPAIPPIVITLTD